MGWSFKVHGGIALAMSVLFLGSAAIAWVPWVSVSTHMTWMPAVAFLLPVGLAALARVLLSRADKRTLWLAFRCLPGRLRVVLGVLTLVGVLLTVVGASQENNLQTDGVEDGRYYVYDTTPLQRGRAEVSSSAYADVLRREQRGLLPAFGAAAAVVAYMVFTAGEVRQADARSKRTHAAWTRGRPAPGGPSEQMPK
ncbi:hypothetical protein [Streptomyces sp. yara]|uniref:hypothetical protein n=1 Tax=Streptomyces sp. yara TaxID=3458421 RepID=UPI004040061F